MVLYFILALRNPAVTVCINKQFSNDRALYYKQKKSTKEYSLITATTQCVTN